MPSNISLSNVALYFLKDLSQEFEFETLLVKFLRGPMRPQKWKKSSLDSLLGHPYGSSRKSRAPSLSLPFCLVEIRSKNSGPRPFLLAHSDLKQKEKLLGASQSMLEPTGFTLISTKQNSHEREGARLYLNGMYGWPKRESRLDLFLFLVSHRPPNKFLLIEFGIWIHETGLLTWKFSK